jgi:hypothetical protein
MGVRAARLWGAEVAAPGKFAGITGRVIRAVIDNR